MADIDSLSKMVLFAGLTREQLTAFIKAGKNVRMGEGQAVLVEGDTGNTMYILTDGKVDISRRLGTTTDDRIGPQKVKRLLTLSAPMFFGEMSLLDDQADRSATVTAATDSEFLEFTREDFERLASEDRELGYRVVYNIALVMAGRLRGTNKDVVKLTAALSLALGNR
jgi:CRP/FNR family transcriptional regulator, cyclic AMP receptor protein